MDTYIQDVVPSRKQTHNIEHNSGYEVKNEKNEFMRKNYVFCWYCRRSIRFFISLASLVSPSFS